MARKITLLGLYRVSLKGLPKVLGPKRYAMEKAARDLQLALAQELEAWLRRKRGVPMKRCVLGASNRLVCAAWRMGGHAVHELASM